MQNHAPLVLALEPDLRQANILKRIIRDLESMSRVEVTHDVAYHEESKLDVYHPARSSAALPCR